jgi:benzoate-CoA ligase
MPLPSEGDRYNAADDLLARAAARGRERVLRCEGRDTSGATLAARVLAVQAELSARGLEPGDRVLLLLRDTPAFHAGFLGAMRGGYVPVPISTLLPPKDVAFIARDAGVRALLLDAELPAAVRDPALFPDGASALVARAGELDGVSSRAEPPAAPTRGADAAFFLYTSGTTGEPKGVVHRHLDLPATAELYARDVLGMGPADRVLSAAKLFFAYGLGNSLTFPLYLGAEVVLLPERPTPESIFALLRGERPTLFFGVPTLYAALLAHPELPAALSGLRLCVSAGEALAAALFTRWRERFGVEILDGLGSTEMLHIFLSNRAGSVRPGSSGTPVAGYRVRIVDEAGRDVRDGEAGTLLAHGPSAAASYHRRPAQTAATMFAPGWLRTGDSYRRDADGFYWHVGRSDDLMKVGGQYVSPVEVEAALAEHPDVVEAAVVAHADEHELVKPHAFVVLRAGARAGDALAAELQAFVKARLAPHKYPRWVEFVDALPRTATGKIQRFVLRKGIA